MYVVYTSLDMVSLAMIIIMPCRVFAPPISMKDYNNNVIIFLPHPASVLYAAIGVLIIIMTFNFVCKFENTKLRTTIALPILGPGLRSMSPAQSSSSLSQ